ncbi:MAG: M20/M25/M40 family metallo-hydrolase [Oscillospiraceae bacterium]
MRADYDALATPEGGAAHLCGHDGHAAALCGVALMLEGQSIGHSVFLLFQGTEETGAGAALCCELFDREKVDEIYGAHNLPGFPFGAVLTRAGTFACASRGVTIHFVGKPAHAAYPETGISPLPQSDSCWSICPRSPRPSSTAASRSAPSSARRWAKRPSARRRSLPSCG